MNKIKIKKIKNKKWKLYLYYNGILIKKVRIQPGEEPANTNYAITVYFKKHIFGSNKVGLVVRPVRLLRNDEESRKTHWGTVIDTGIEI